MILLDTNILVHAAGASSPRHATAKELRDQAAEGQLEACIAPQVLTEFYAVVTNPRRFQPALTPSQAQKELRAYLSSSLKLILPKQTTVSHMLQLRLPCGEKRENFRCLSCRDDARQRCEKNLHGEHQRF